MNNPLVLNAEGHDARRTGDWETAIEKFTALVDEGESLAYYEQSLVCRGIVYRMVDDLELALEDFNTLLKRESVPENIRAAAHFYRGCLYHVMGDPNAADADHTAYLGHLKAGRLMHMAFAYPLELEQAAADCENAAAVGQFCRGIAFEILRRVEPALQAYQRAVDMDISLEPDVTERMAKTRAILNEIQIHEKHLMQPDMQYCQVRSHRDGHQQFYEIIIYDQTGVLENRDGEGEFSAEEFEAEGWKQTSVYHHKEGNTLYFQRQF